MAGNTATAGPGNKFCGLALTSRCQHGLYAMMTMSPVIRAFLYTPETRQLTIAFINRRIHVYVDVPPHLGEALIYAESRTLFFNTYIRNLYRRREVVAAAA
jgi:hypothetical protein